MIEVQVFETDNHQWLVIVNSLGASRIVAACPYPQYAEAVAQGLDAVLTDENVEALLGAQTGVH
jgi:hypothetical protein